WQWVLLRLLLNEQALIEKVENHDVPLYDAIKFSSPSPEKAASASENENNFIQILLTRLLVRPDAAPLFAELIHLFGRPTTDSLTIEGDNKKFDNTSLEGEVVEEGTYLKRCQQQVIERALTELLLPSIDQSSDEARNSFATDLVKQLSYIETHIIAITGGSKPLGGAPAGVEGQPNKVNNRKNLRTGSAALSRRPIVATNSSPPSPAALRASMSLQLQLLLRFLPTLCTDR
ncbi:hypothetical protein LR48_Vigan07g244400, partial [Vigna angularis]